MNDKKLNSYIQLPDNLLNKITERYLSISQIKVLLFLCFKNRTADGIFKSKFRKKEFLLFYNSKIDNKKILELFSKFKIEKLSHGLYSYHYKGIKWRYKISANYLNLATRNKNNYKKISYSKWLTLLTIKSHITWNLFLYILYHRNSAKNGINYTTFLNKYKLAYNKKQDLYKYKKLIENSLQILKENNLITDYIITNNKFYFSLKSKIVLPEVAAYVDNRSEKTKGIEESNKRSKNKTDMEILGYNMSTINEDDLVIDFDNEL